MSNNVKRAIDTGLNGLYVTQRDADAILRRVHKEEPKRQAPPIRFAAVLAAAMMMVLIGTGWTLMERTGGRENADPLTSQGSMAVPADCISAEEAVALAEAYVYAQGAASADLRDESAYRIECSLCPPDLYCPSWHYTVTFHVLDLYGTDCEVDVLAERGVTAPIHRMQTWRGVGEGNTPDEMRRGYMRLYGDDMYAWTYDVLNAYADSLLRAAPQSLTWADELVTMSVFLDPAGVAPAEQADKARSAVLMSAEGRRLWKLALPETENGIACVRLVEQDADTGEIVSSFRVDEANVGFLPFIATASIRENWQVLQEEDSPELSGEKARELAAAYLRQRYGVDVSDPTRYECAQVILTSINQYGRRVRYDPIAGDDHWYWVALDYNGVPRDSGEVSIRTDGIVDLDEIRYTYGHYPDIQPEDASRFNTAENYDYVALKAIRDQIALKGDPSDPIAMAILNTIYTYQGTADIHTIAGQALNSKVQLYRGMASGLSIEKEGCVIQKAAFETDKGIFLVEVDVNTNEVNHILCVENLRDCWYAPFLLQEDMEAAGIAPLPYTPPANDGRADIDAPYEPVSGLRIDYLAADFRRIYSPDIADWSQAQLRTFQRYATMADGQDGDMSIYALRRTWYPDVPPNAISHEEAAEKAAAHLGMKEWTFDGAVLIGTDANPVWKVCLFSGESPIWYVEVDCLTGEIRDMKQRQDVTAMPFPAYNTGAPQPEYWFRDIVLEETIRECEKDWDRRSNG